ncbi:MAG TPA: hypothetical protein VH417_17125 [Vicinamibacterales bacterium]
MKRAGIVTIVAAAAALLVVWIARNTRWEETSLPMPPKGEALTNPFYAVQKFATLLGATAVRDGAFVTPPPGAVVVLASWHWTLGQERRQAIERWVDAGGRLVVEGSMLGGEREFERWTGIEHRFRDRTRERDSISEPGSVYCDDVQEEVPSDSIERSPAAAGRVICELNEASALTTIRPAVWSLKGRSGVQAARVRLGRGSVTWINAEPFQRMNLFEGDHGWLFVAATELRKGDEMHFLSEEDHPPLLTLIWRHGAPVVVLGLAAIALLLWRGGVRFGPLAAEEPSARRSLAEQLRGTAHFALRHGGGGALYAAELRALDEAAARRVAGYARLAPNDRTAALTAVTPIDRGTLAAAIVDPRVGRSHDLRTTLTVLEAARRYILRDHTKATHAAD